MPREAPTASGGAPVPPWSQAAAPPWQQQQNGPPQGGGVPPTNAGFQPGGGQQQHPQPAPQSQQPVGAPDVMTGQVSWLERVYRGRPLRYPSIVTWIASGFSRNPRGAIVAFIVAWFNVVPALLMALFGAITGGIFGGLRGLLGGVVLGNDVPFLGQYMPNLGTNLGGIGGLVVGVVLGAVLGFLFVFAGPYLYWWEQDPARAIGLAVGQILSGIVLGLAYAILHNAFEGTILRIKGARQPSRREDEFLIPIVREIADRLGMRGIPRVLIDDSRDINAYAGARHIVIYQGLLDEFEYDREAVAGVLAHELTHWNNADAMSSIFVRGVALPIYLPYTFFRWLQKFLGPIIGKIFVLVFWWLIWPYEFVMRFMIRPAVASDTRPAEMRADQGAVDAGHRDGMRKVLVRLRRTVDTGLSGWDEAICRSHPPNELRLERIEEPGKSYPMPDPDGPVLSSASTQTSSLLRD